MDAIITAGGIPLPEDPLYEYSRGDSKALIDIAGKPMIQWILDAINNAEKVDNVIIVGLSPKCGVTCRKPIYFLQNEGRMLANIVAGVNKALALNPTTQHVLIISSDVPAITGEMIDWLIDQVNMTKGDLYYGAIPREVMEKRYPNSRRTWTHLKDMDVCGADVNATHVRMTTEHLETWEELIGNRKSPLKQASVIGFGTLIGLLFRQLTLDDLVKRVCESIGIDGHAVIWQWAEAGMDVDKPHQLEMMREDLGKPQTGSTM
jgi:GTP:adenosylcobinamide-phosphate guanylyltransferase